MTTSINLALAQANNQFVSFAKKQDNLTDADKNYFIKEFLDIISFLKSVSSSDAVIADQINTMISLISNALEELNSELRKASRMLKLKIRKAKNAKTSKYNGIKTMSKRLAMRNVPSKARQWKPLKGNYAKEMQVVRGWYNDMKKYDNKKGMKSASKAILFLRLENGRK